jgi:hypothetical protein
MGKVFNDSILCPFNLVLLKRDGSAYYKGNRNAEFQGNSKKRAAPNLFSMKLPLVRFLQRLNSLPTSAGQGFVPSCRILPAAECIVEVPESLRGVLKSQERERER